MIHALTIASRFLFPIGIFCLMFYVVFKRSGAVEYAIEHSNNWRALRRVRRIYIFMQTVCVFTSLFSMYVVYRLTDYAFLFLSVAFLLLARGLDPPGELERRLIEVRARDEAPSVERR